MTARRSFERLPGEVRQDSSEDAYTFGLRYPTQDVEEIDVWARSYAQARTRLDAIVARDYDPSYEAILDLPVGGSGGWAVIPHA